MAAGATSAGDRQDIRVAVVMNGGVSLAVWMSGVALELHHLVMASRNRAETDWPEYADVLDLLDASARVDVIAGTSAGGLNGGFLSLGLVRDCDLSGMRELWRDTADFAALLRDPLQKAPKSLLRGDDYFLPKLREAYRTIMETGGVARDATEAPVELVLTGTLWAGRRSSFTDDMGTGITEVDYDGRFYFSNSVDGAVDAGDLSQERVIDQLAVASRCTASFPGAFEPHWVSTAHAPPGGSDTRWPSTAGAASFPDSQYVVDGGVLVNKPIRPALDAVHRQQADAQVRRVLAYVVPDPGERPAQTADGDGTDTSGSATAPAVPGAYRVALEVFTRLRSTDSVARELEEIRDRNETVDARRRARARLAGAMTRVASDVAAHAWDAYGEVRGDHAARTIGALIAQGQSREVGAWSQAELIAALRRVQAAFVPGGTLREALARQGPDWDWGQTTAERLGDMALDVLKRAIWLAPIGGAQRGAIAECRARVHETLGEIRAVRREAERYWTRAPGRPDPRMPERASARRGPATNLPELEQWLEDVATRWDRGDLQARRRRLYGGALRLAETLTSCSQAIADVVETGNPRIDPDGVETALLRELSDYLLAAASDPREVLRRMLQLDVVQLAFADAMVDVEQQVELVQISALDPTRLTGIQEHHFGAFYRASWRVNDWLRGRMDATEQLLQILLSPERLRQLGYGDDRDPLGSVRELAVGSGIDAEWLEVQWASAAAACEEELECLTRTEPLPPALPRCARQIARRIQTGILREELPQLAAAIRREPDPVGFSAKWAESLEQAMRSGAGGAADIPAAQLWELYSDAGEIGAQRIREDVGTDTFARTVSQGAAVATNTVAALPGRRFRLVGAILSALRGYALALWAMVKYATLGSRFGATAVDLAVAAGAVLVGVTLVVPGIPPGVTLVGVLLLLAGWSAATLLAADPQGTEGASTREIGLRLVVVFVIALAAVIAWLVFDFRSDPGGSVLLEALIKAGVATGIVVLGWWVARVRPPSSRA